MIPSVKVNRTNPSPGLRPPSPHFVGQGEGQRAFLPSFIASGISQIQAVNHRRAGFGSKAALQRQCCCCWRGAWLPCVVRARGCGVGIGWSSAMPDHHPSRGHAGGTLRGGGISRGTPSRSPGQHSHPGTEQRRPAGVRDSGWPGPIAASVFPEVDLPAFGGEEYAIHSAGRRLLLAGGRPRGTLYAVYRFLQDNLGVRWYTPWFSQYPHAPTS